MTENNWRLINTNCNNAYLNMAIDEALLISEKPVLRFYKWKPAAISLGYSQSINEININQCEKLGIDYVRRLTGGKAVLHDKELTYSFIINEYIMPKKIVDSYMVISNGILFALKLLGIDASMKDSINKPASSSICFNEPSYYEITVGNRKLVGSAQTRKNFKILQHGSILLGIDIEKMCSLFNNCTNKIINYSKKRITSINELNKKIKYNDLIRALKQGFEENFQIKLKNDSLTNKELMLAKKLAKQKYSTKEWNFRF